MTGVTEAPPSARGPLRAEHFTDPFTRRLLTHTGLTTRLLEEHLGGPVRLDLVEQGEQPDTGARPALRALLRLGRDEPWLVRRTQLVDSAGHVVSRNLVLGARPHDTHLARALTDTHVPLGEGLSRGRLAQRRTPLGVGLAPWPPPPARHTAAWRSYLILVGEENPLYVEELFHPSVAPARVTQAPAPGAAEAPAPAPDTPAPAPGTPAPGETRWTG